MYSYIIYIYDCLTNTCYYNAVDNTGRLPVHYSNSSEVKKLLMKVMMMMMVVVMMLMIIMIMIMMIMMMMMMVVVVIMIMMMMMMMTVSMKLTSLHFHLHPICAYLFEMNNRFIYIDDKFMPLSSQFL